MTDTDAEYAFGSVTGRLEQLNVHDGVNRFTLLPLIGPRISGVFPEAVKTLIEGGFDRRVRLYGRLKFPSDENYPREIDQVTDIEVFEPDDELPRLTDLRGIVPDATGGMNIRDFVESLYDGDYTHDDRCPCEDCVAAATGDISDGKPEEKS